MVLHIGSGMWVVVDSCINHCGAPQALEYLEGIGIDPAESVGLVVATHWHDDHIRGMSRVVEVCRKARFCCASALCRKEFLAAVHALEGRHFTGGGSGVREIHGVFSRLESRNAPPVFALEGRRLYARDEREIWSLSPRDVEYLGFLKSIGNLFPRAGQTKVRMPDVSPNDVAIVLWMRVENIAVLLGSDLEKCGWVAILKDEARPTDKASVFKVAHHGSASAHVQGVWQDMLGHNPFAVLTPWRRGGRALPTKQDAQRILEQTQNAFITASTDERPRTHKRRDPAVTRTLRGSNVRLREYLPKSGAIRLRHPMSPGMQWTVEMFGPACHLDELVA